MEYTILIVDDNPSAIEILKDILKKEYDLKIAIDGVTALKIVKKSLPDLIILDIMMPKMDGYEVCKKLKDCTKTHDIPIIFITRMSDEHNEDVGFELGAVDYITKPISGVTVKARVKTHLSLAHQQKELDIQIIEKTKELSKSRVDLVKKLGVAAEFKDNDIGNHIIRVSKYCELISAKYGFKESDSKLLSLAAPMHDIGKIGISDKILNKPGKLNTSEFRKIKTHTIIGEKILGDNTDPLLKLATIIVSQHHEKWDGTGYPNGYSGTEININARILSIADVFDALISKRSYKKPWKLEKAFDYISEQSGLHFDPDIVDIFLSLKKELYLVSNEFKD